MLTRTVNAGFQLASSIVASADNLLKNRTPSQIIVATLGTYFFVQQVYSQYRYWDSEQAKKDIEDALIRIMSMMPYIGPDITRKIDQELSKVLSDLRQKVQDSRNNFHDEDFAGFHAEGMSSSRILHHLGSLQDIHKQGKCSGAVYAIKDEKLLSLLKDVWGKTAYTNPMHNDWPLINLMRSDVLSICHEMLQSPLHELLARDKSYTCLPGVMTTGGSASIEEACFAYVRVKRKQGYPRPVILVPESAHVAFDKCVDKFNARKIKIPLNKLTGQADIDATRKLVEYYKHEIAVMVGSAPSFPYGIIDDIPTMARIAKDNDIYFHIDACLGGFLTPFLLRSEEELPACDFSVPGVSSISLDTHKYAQAPKGTSVLVFHPEVTKISTDIHDQCVSTAHVYLGWQGGMYVTQDSRGSQSGADIATAWATIHYHGRNFYEDEAKKIYELRADIEDKLSRIDGVELAYPGSKKLNVVGIRSIDKINLLEVQKYFNQGDKNGWSIQNTQTSDFDIEGLHFCITSAHTEQENFCQKFCDNIQAAIHRARQNPDDQKDATFEVYKKFKKGVPQSVQYKIGCGYAALDNLPLKPGSA